MRGIKYKVCFTSTLLFFLVLLPSMNKIYYAEDSLLKFFPTPTENIEEGRNTHVYLPFMEGPSTKEQEIFINEIASYAIKANDKWGIPAAAIIGMAALESGYGTTRIAYFANNLFGIKVWDGDASNAWQLQGQPDEDFDRAIPVLAHYGEDRIVFDESTRRDNWYRKFDSYREAVAFLAGTLLVNDRYVFARDEYQKRLKDGWRDEDATKEFLYNIADAGYNHLGGSYYRESVGRLIDNWNLLSYHLGDSQYTEGELHNAELAEDLHEEGSRTPFHETELEKLQERKIKVLLRQESIEVRMDEVPSSENSIFRTLQHVFAKIIRLFN